MASGILPRSTLRYTCRITSHSPHTRRRRSARFAKLEGISGLELSPAELDEAAERAQEEIDRQMGDSEEIQALVGVLESQYDAFQEQRGAGIPVDGPLPSADELGEEFEKFLAQQRWDLPPGQ